MAKHLTTTQFFRQFPDDETCLQHLFNVRFGQGFACPSCERPSNWYRIKAERAYSCQWCGHHLHPTVGTPFEQTRTPLQLWFYAIHLFTTTRHGVSGKELERQLGVTYKTAWRMAKLIREHMADVDGNAPIGEGKTVQIDETFVGGRFARGHRGGNPAEGKSIVFGMMEHGGEIVTHVVRDRTRETIFPLVKASVQPHSAVHTDEYRTYLTVGKIPGMAFTHESVNYRAGEYVCVRTGATVNAIENFWRQLKRRSTALILASARSTLAPTPRSSSTASIAGTTPLRCCRSCFRRSGHCLHGAVEGVLVAGSILLPFGDKLL